MLLEETSPSHRRVLPEGCVDTASEGILILLTKSSFSQTVFRGLAGV